MLSIDTLTVQISCAEPVTASFIFAFIRRKFGWAWLRNGLILQLHYIYLLILEYLYLPGKYSME